MESCHAEHSMGGITCWDPCRIPVHQIYVHGSAFCIGSIETAMLQSPEDYIVGLTRHEANLETKKINPWAAHQAQTSIVWLHDVFEGVTRRRGGVCNLTKQTLPITTVCQRRSCWKIRLRLSNFCYWIAIPWKRFAPQPGFMVTAVPLAI